MPKSIKKTVEVPFYCFSRAEKMKDPIICSTQKFRMEISCFQGEKLKIISSAQTTQIENTLAHIKIIFKK